MLSMLNAIGRILVVSIWKLANKIERHLMDKTNGTRGYWLGYLRLGMRKTLNHFKQFDDDVREHLLIMVSENDDEREKSVAVLSDMLIAYTELLAARIVVVQAAEKYEKTEYWYTNCAFLTR